MIFWKSVRFISTLLEIQKVDAILLTRSRWSLEEKQAHNISLLWGLSAFTFTNPLIQTHSDFVKVDVLRNSDQLKAVKIRLSWTIGAGSEIFAYQPDIV